MTAKSSLARIAICMGSQSDWSTMKAAADILDQFGAAHEVKIISAHRTPARLSKFAETAHENGFGVIIAGAGGAAHLPGMIAAHTHLPVLGVPVGTLAIGVAGAKNAALLAVQILALSDADLGQRIIAWRQSQTDNVAEAPE